MISFGLLAGNRKRMGARLGFLSKHSIRKSTVVASSAMLRYLATSMSWRTSLWSLMYCLILVLYCK